MAIERYIEKDLGRSLNGIF